MSPTNPVTSSSNSSNNSAAATTASTSPLANESTFLTLLVSQLQNQDPLNPTDSTQFVTQLTGYSQLEQLINIDNNTAPPAGATTGSGTGGTDSADSTKTSEI